MQDQKQLTPSYELAKFIFEKLKIYNSFSINKIPNNNPELEFVFIKLTFAKNEKNNQNIRITYKIKSCNISSNHGKHFHYENDNIAEVSTIEELDKFLQSFKDIINNERYDNYKGGFINNKIEKRFTTRKMGDILKYKLFAINDECCVCNEKTLTKTYCDHYLCSKCWEKICQDNKNLYPKCPLCRESIGGREYNWFQQL